MPLPVIISRVIADLVAQGAYEAARELWQRYQERGEPIVEDDRGLDPLEYEAQLDRLLRDGECEEWLGQSVFSRR